MERKDRSELFRAEALEHYQRGEEDEAHLLEVEPKWARRASRVIVALFVAALLFAALARIDRHAEGVGVVRGGRLIAAVPARHRHALEPSLPLHFEYSEQPLALATVGTKIVTPSEILGADASARWTSPEPAVRVEAALPPGRLGDGVAGRVRIRLGRERLLAMLVPWSRRG